jgi:hypothetical protein
VNLLQGKLLLAELVLEVADIGIAHSFQSDSRGSGHLVKENNFLLEYDFIFERSCAAEGREEEIGC